jgi:hypothetical protein
MAERESTHSDSMAVRSLRRSGCPQAVHTGGSVLAGELDLLGQVAQLFEAESVFCEIESGSHAADHVFEEN